MLCAALNAPHGVAVRESLWRNALRLLRPTGCVAVRVGRDLGHAELSTRLDSGWDVFLHGELVASSL